MPGEVVSVGAEEINVALSGAALVVKKMRGDGGKISAAEFAKQAAVQIGSRLG